MNENFRSWKKWFEKNDISGIIKEVYTNKNVLPYKKDVLKCFELTSLDNLNVVIIGQDPYYNRGVADGLAFSCSNQNKATPASLKNIFKELNYEYPNIKQEGNSLQKWAEQGILLLNTSLTVEEGKPLSHIKFWEKPIKNLIQYIDQNKNDIIFVLWGSRAKNYKYLIKNNATFETSHPSPLSFNKGFYKSNCFKKINEFLKSKRKNEIDWNL